MNTSNAPLTCFSLTIADHVAHLVLNRPEAMNTMNPAFWRELDDVLTQLDGERGVQQLGAFVHRVLLDRVEVRGVLAADGRSVDATRIRFQR